MSASLECYLPLYPSHRVTSVNNKIYANEQLLPVSQRVVFEFSDLMLNNRELISTCTLPAFVKFPLPAVPLQYLSSYAYDTLRVSPRTAVFFNSLLTAAVFL